MASSSLKEAPPKTDGTLTPRLPFAGGVGTAIDVKSRLARHVSRLRRRWLGWAGLGVLLLLLLAAALAPWLAPVDPNAIDLAHKLEGPSASHLLGTDHLGRDLLSRLLHGGRTALMLGLLSVLGSIVLAVIAGGCSGYFGGTADLLLSATFNVLLTVPGLILTLAIIGVLGTGQLSLLIALIGADWASQARIIRGAVLEAREQGYVEAARVVGARDVYLLVRHIVPNVAGTIAVLATLDLAGVVLTISSLSFLGIGVQPPQADWGTMLSDSRPFAGSYPHLMLLPGACIVLFALAANLAGDALRDLLDPRGR
jgi:ABC-type dipeptide/oligopeptide/nickel transport system permease subunit